MTTPDPPSQGRREAPARPGHGEMVLAPQRGLSEPDERGASGLHAGEGGKDGVRGEIRRGRRWSQTA